MRFRSASPFAGVKAAHDRVWGQQSTWSYPSNAPFSLARLGEEAQPVDPYADGADDPKPSNKSTWILVGVVGALVLLTMWKR